MSFDLRARISDMVDAARMGDIATVTTFVRNHPAWINEGDWDGTTMLLSAAWYGRVDLIRALIKLGASCDVADHQNWTPITAAVHENFSDAALLLAQKSSPQHLKMAINMARLNNQQALAAALVDYLPSARAVTSVGLLRAKKTIYNPFRQKGG